MCVCLSVYIYPPSSFMFCFPTLKRTSSPHSPRGRIQGGGDINTALGLLPDKLKTELALHVNLLTLKKVLCSSLCCLANRLATVLVYASLYPSVSVSCCICLCLCVFSVLCIYIYNCKYFLCWCGYICLFMSNFLLILLSVYTSIYLFISLNICLSTSICWYQSLKMCKQTDNKGLAQRRPIHRST